MKKSLYFYLIIAFDKEKKQPLRGQLRVDLEVTAKQNNIICSNMDGPSDFHTEWGMSDKDKYDIYMWNL